MLVPHQDGTLRTVQLASAMVTALVCKARMKKKRSVVHVSTTPLGIIVSNVRRVSLATPSMGASVSLASATGRAPPVTTGQATASAQPRASLETTVRSATLRTTTLETPSTPAASMISPLTTSSHSTFQNLRTNTTLPSTSRMSQPSQMSMSTSPYPAPSMPR